MKIKPSNFELQVLGVLWEEPGLTVREVRERFSDGKERAYTSVLSVMQVMERKGLLSRRRPEKGSADLWRAAVRRDAVSRPLLRRLMDQVFGGRPSLVMQHLLGSKSVDRQEIDEIRRLLEAYESELDDKEGSKEGKSKP